MNADTLRSDSRVIKALERLKGAGLSDAACETLLARTAAIPRRHEELMRETAPEAMGRRAELGRRLRETADAIDEDPDAAFYPHYGGPDGKEPRVGDVPQHEREMSLADWLRDCAEHLEATTYSMPLLESRKGHENLKTFVMRGVSYWVRALMRDGRTYNVETALLSSAILGDDVDANDVTQARRGERRRYWRE